MPGRCGTDRRVGGSASTPVIARGDIWPPGCPTVQRVEGPPLSRDLVGAYLGGVDWLLDILGRAEVRGAWAQPSLLPDYSVGGLAAHAVHGVVWLEQLLKDTQPVGLRRVSVFEFFGPNRVEKESVDPIAVSLQSAAEAFAHTGADAVTAACTTSRKELLGLLEGGSSDRAVPVLRVAGGQVALCDYVRTRVLDVVVHGTTSFAGSPASRRRTHPCAPWRSLWGPVGAGPGPGGGPRHLARFHAHRTGAARSAARAVKGQASTLRRKFFRPRVKKTTLNSMMAG